MISEAKIISARKAREILGNYPASGSSEEARDIRLLRKFQIERTKEECALAQRQEKASVENFFVAGNGPLNRREARRFPFAMLKVYIESGLSAHIAKKEFRRPRPYRTWSDLKPCVKYEKSYAYPSGHTTLARVMAHVLAYKYPERANEILSRGDEIARNRVLAGVHHPSDIEAGRKLGDYVAGKMFLNKAFMKQLDEM